MRRWIVGALLLVVVVAGCAHPDQKMRASAAQAAREAVSEVNTTRLAVEQLRAHRLWSQPAGQLVQDAETGLAKVSSSFSSQQPSTVTSARLYEQVTKVMEDAESAVTAVRIALGNNDLAAAERQLAALRQAGRDLGAIGELAK